MSGQTETTQVAKQCRECPSVKEKFGRYFVSACCPSFFSCMKQTDAAKCVHCQKITLFASILHNFVECRVFLIFGEHFKDSFQELNVQLSQQT